MLVCFDISLESLAEDVVSSGAEEEWERSECVGVRGEDKGRVEPSGWEVTGAEEGEGTESDGRERVKRGDKGVVGLAGVEWSEKREVGGGAEREEIWGE